MRAARPAATGDDRVGRSRRTYGDPVASWSGDDTMRTRQLSTAALTATLLAACGSGTTSAPPPVRLTVTAPGDRAVVREEQVEVRGTVRPSSARVTVAGRRATVTEGAFRATVSLAAGTNVIDVMAEAGRARPALTAIRVRRDVSVEVPDVVGVSVPQAMRELEGAGLRAKVDNADDFFDRLLPGEPNVCETDPQSGARVQRGTTVHLRASRGC
jgi:hypothetical protein